MKAGTPTVATNITSARAQQTPHWPALDGLRGIASLLVIVYHFVPFDPARTRLARAFTGLAHLGWVGVDVFFALSGFLITQILLRAKGSEFALKSFYARRLLRITPLYYLTLIVVFVVLPLVHAPLYFSPSHDTVDHQSWLWVYAYNLRVLWTGDYWADEGLRLSHFWSLSVEEHFYLVWPFLVLWASRRNLLRFSVAAVVMIPLFRIGLILAGVSDAIVYTFTLCRVDSLIVGALVAVQLSNGNIGARVKRLAPAVFAACAACFGALLLQSGNASTISRPMEAVGFSALSFAAAAVIVLAIQPAPTLLGRVLGLAPLRWVGRYSYGAYVLHLLFQPALDCFASTRRMERLLDSEVLGLVTHVTVGLFVTMLAAVTSYHLFEKPFLDLKRFFEYSPRSDNPQ